MAEFVNLLKLCVGADRVEDLLAWQEQHYGSGPAWHVTRMWPKRAPEILAGGSLYWVFKGQILARQRILGLHQRQGDDGLTRCAIELDRAVIRTESQPRRPFQGWRYLPPAESPRDLSRASRPGAGAGDAAADGAGAESPLPEALARALAEIGLR